MKVIVACECSNVVRDEFIARGHDAWSCDLLPAERGGPHIQDDILNHLGDGWDLMIAHPECTYLTCSAEWAYRDGPYHMELKPDTLVGAARRQARRRAISFAMKLAGAKIPKIGLENPVGVLSREWRKPDQIIQPYQFGDDASKSTCLWLVGLPRLRIDPAERCHGRHVMHRGKPVERWSNQTADRTVLARMKIEARTARAPTQV